MSFNRREALDELDHAQRQLRQVEAERDAQRHRAEQFKRERDQYRTDLATREQQMREQTSQIRYLERSRIHPGPGVGLVELRATGRLASIKAYVESLRSSTELEREAQIATDLLYLIGDDS